MKINPKIAIIATLCGIALGPRSAAANPADLQFRLEHWRAVRELGTADRQRLRGLELPDEAIAAGVTYPFEALLQQRAAITADEESEQRVETAIQNGSANSLRNGGFRLAGVTHASPSMALCGSNAVSGYLDSTVFRQSTIDSDDRWSSMGYSYSTDGGKTFAQAPGIAVPAGPLPDYSSPYYDRTGKWPIKYRYRDFLGDPVVGCSNSSTFYYLVQVWDQAIRCPAAGVPGKCFGAEARTSLHVFISKDGGRTFSRSAVAVAGAWQDMSWMAVLLPDTSMSVSRGPSGDVIDLAYGDQERCVWTTKDWRAEIAKCAGTKENIKYTHSTNGGASWSAPAAAAVYPQRYDWSLRRWFWNLPETPKVVRGLGSDVFVTWRTFYWPGWNPNPNLPPYPVESQIKVRRSTDGGATFGPTATAADVTITGTLQGRFATAPIQHSLAVDTSKGPNAGTVYLSWQDGRNRSVPSFGADGTTYWRYRFSDVLLTRSIDGGTTWSAPARVNDDASDLNVDHFFPTLTVDRNGRLYTLFYDRRNDPRNFLIDTYVATSDDGGLTFANSRLTRESMPPLTAVPGDLLVNPYWQYFGRKIGIAADSSGRGAGVVAAWGDTSLGNLNIVTRTIGSNDEKIANKDH